MSSRKTPKARVEREVEIPGPLRDFLAHVSSLIIAADPDAMIESDDLLQDESVPVYGGRIYADGDEWGFTYFPADDARVKWELLLTSAQLAAIASGETKTLTLGFCRNAKCGNAFFDRRVFCLRCDYERSTRTKFGPETSG